MGSQLPVCFECKKILRHLQTRLACSQYPKGVPHEIVMGKPCIFYEPAEDWQLRDRKKRR